MTSSPAMLVIRFMLRYPWRVATGLGLAVAGSLLGFVFPGVTRWFLDDIIPSGDTSRILPAVGIALGAMALRQVFYALRTVANNAFELRMTHDVRATQRVVIEAIDQTAPALIQILVTAALMLWLHPKLALVTMIPVPLIA